MTEIDPRLEEALLLNVNSEVIRLAPAVSLASSMLALAGAFGRDQLTSSNQYQLNATAAMLQLSREYGAARRGLAADEALDLALKVVAAVQAP